MVDRRTIWQKLMFQSIGIVCNPPTRHCYDAMRKGIGLGPCSDEKWEEVRNELTVR